MNEEEAREILKRIDIKFFLCGMNEQSNYIVDEANKVNNAIETVLNLLEKKDKDIIEAKEANRQLSIELQKKDKIIDLIAKELVKAHEWFYSEFDNYTKEDFIKYFEKKVEEE